jgi:aspartate/methionine/tyrosine aminotransferase
MNPLVAEIPSSLIRTINARKQPGDIDLGLGEPTLRPDLAPFQRALERVREQGCPYTANAGDPELRAAIARYTGVGEADRVCVSVGSEEALYLAIKTVVDPAAHEVLVVEPCYLAYPKICMLEGIAHRTVALAGDDGFRPRAAAVLEALGPRTRLLVLNTPSNPTGRVWPAAELRALAEGLLRRDGEPVFVLADEVYRELCYHDEPVPSLAELYPHTLVAGSLSKSNALTGLRLGWLAGPQAVIAAATKVHQFVNTAASTYSQHVALEIFRTPEALGAHRAHYATQRHLLIATLAEQRVEHIAPEGAFYCLLRLPPRLRGDSLQAALALLDAERVVAVPGVAFGTSAEGWLRISWVAPAETLADGICRIARFFGDS